MKQTVAILLAAILAVSSIGCTAQPAPDPAPVINDTTGAVSTVIPTVTVSGAGELTLAPDMATLQFGVEARQKDTAEEATTEVAAALEAVKAALIEIGVLEEDIQTTNFSLSEDYRWDSNGNIIGKPRYTVSNTVSAKFYDMEQIGNVIDAAIAAGATSSYGVQFSLKDPTARESEAMLLAFENAKTKAEQLATAAGKQLGDVLLLNDGTQITEQVFTQNEMMMDAAAPESAARSYGTTIQPGTLKVQGNVSVRFMLK